MAVLPRFIDTHSHLNHPDFADDWELAVRRALEANTWLIVVGTDYDSSVRAVEMAERFPFGVYAAVGVHPRLVYDEAKSEMQAIDQVMNIEAFRKLVQHPKVVALGEVGLDYHHLVDPGTTDSKRRDREMKMQQDVLARFLSLSHEFRLPLIMHVREAHEELANLLHNFDLSTTGFDARGVIHHFTGTWEDASRYLHLNFLLSITGLLVRSRIRESVIKKIPLDRLLVESDCRHLTSEPTAPSCVEPEYLLSIIHQLAALKNVPADELAEATTRNALRIFSKIVRTLPS